MKLSQTATPPNTSKKSLHRKCSRWLKKQYEIYDQAHRSMIYGSFALMVWHWLPFVVLAWVWGGLFAVNIRLKEASMSRYPSGNNWKRAKWQSSCQVFGKRLYARQERKRCGLNSMSCVLSLSPHFFGGLRFASVACRLCQKRQHALKAVLNAFDGKNTASVAVPRDEKFEFERARKQRALTRPCACPWTQSALRPSVCPRDPVVSASAVCARLHPVRDASGGVLHALLR